MMYNLMTPFYERKKFLKKQRPICLKTVMRRYQLMELFGLTGAIVLIWLGAMLDNRLSATPKPEATSVGSTSADLTIGVPVGKGRTL
jgi:hypothetical protein